MTLEEKIVKNIIHKLINGKDYRIEVVTLIDAEFLQFAVDFLKKIAEAKSANKDLDVDWYKKEMMNPNLPSDDIAIHSGLNKKTITNMYNSSTREIVIDASGEHYDKLSSVIDSLVNPEELNLMLQIKFGEVSVELNMTESLMVINALAVKRAALRGGFWSTAGKQVEGPLMLTLCKLFGVSESHYSEKPRAKKIKKGEVNREVDFFLLQENNEYKCEVKLMGKGNPESADAVVARGSRVFIADKLSEQNKAQLDEIDVEWVEMRSEQGYEKFSSVLDALEIPYQQANRKRLDAKIKKIFSEIFPSDN